MKEEQWPLIYTGMMASSRDVNRQLRARLRENLHAHIAAVGGSTSSESGKIAGVKFPAQDATTPGCAPSTRRGSSQANLTQDEMSLRDDRTIDISKAPRCPTCYARPVLQRVSNNDPVHPEMRYRVMCPRMAPGSAFKHYDSCKDQATPWMKDSAAAVRHWTLAIKLGEL